jgi:hypothetical protein
MSNIYYPEYQNPSSESDAREQDPGTEISKAFEMLSIPWSGSMQTSYKLTKSPTYSSYLKHHRPSPRVAASTTPPRINPLVPNASNSAPPAVKYERSEHLALSHLALCIPRPFAWPVGDCTHLSSAGKREAHTWANPQRCQVLGTASSHTTTVHLYCCGQLVHTRRCTNVRSIEHSHVIQHLYSRLEIDNESRCAYFSSWSSHKR